VVGDSLCHCGCPSTVDLARSFREVNSRSSDHDFGSDGDYRNRNEVEAETPYMVLDHHDCSCGSSCPVGLVGSVDDQMGSCLCDYPNRYADLFLMRQLGQSRTGYHQDSCRQALLRCQNLASDPQPLPLRSLALILLLLCPASFRGFSGNFLSPLLRESICTRFTADSPTLLSDL
jgi:hypothetical protein